MKKTINLMTAAALLLAAGVSADAADKRYPIAYVQKVEITDPSRRNIAWENKDFLNCDDVVLTEEDVRYALRHMRRVSWKGYDPEQVVDATGCEGEALVTFKNGRVLAMGIEPTGRIGTAEYDRKADIVAGSTSFYECSPCRTRKMALLKDALNRADERRLKRLVAEGRISEVEAERRLNWVRDQRDKP